MSFEKWISHVEILKALREKGFTIPTPIQEQAIPKIIAGLDIFASAQTGSGKSAAFLLPALEKIASAPAKHKGIGPRVLVLVPTRELALQLETEALYFSKHLPKFKVVSVVGGASYFMQNKKLSSFYEVLIATPGRLIDHMEKDRIDFSKLELLILDEADRMLDMGFIPAVQKIAERLPEERQTLLFSATLKPTVKKLVEKWLKKPCEIKIHGDKEQHQDIEEEIVYVGDREEKIDQVKKKLQEEGVKQAIVFTATKRQADVLSRDLIKEGFEAEALHGDMPQHKRFKTIARLKEGKVRFLIATDVAARGIDIATISHVINFDMPMVAEDYVHRIGRTGRAGAKGKAISFVSPRDKALLKEIEKFVGRRLSKGEEPDSKKPSLPKKKSKASSQEKPPFSRKKRFSFSKRFKKNKKKSFSRS